MACPHDHTITTQDGTRICRSCFSSIAGQPFSDGAAVIPDDRLTVDEIGMALLFVIGILGAIGSVVICTRILLAG